MSSGHSASPSVTGRPRLTILVPTAHADTLEAELAPLTGPQQPPAYPPTHADETCAAHEHEPHGRELALSEAMSVDVLNRLGLVEDEEEGAAGRIVSPRMFMSAHDFSHLILPAGTATPHVLDLLKPPLPMSSCEAHLHLVKSNLGAGCLALPLAFAQAGVPVGVGLLVCTALQGTYSMLLLARLKTALANSAEARNRSLLGEHAVATFEDLGLAAFGLAGKRAIELFVVALQLGICCVYISLVATNLHAGLGGLLQHKACLLLVGGVCALLSLLRDLSSLWPLSTAANGFMLTACVTAVSVAAISLAQQQHAESASLARSSSFGGASVDDGMFGGTGAAGLHNATNFSTSGGEGGSAGDLSGSTGLGAQLASAARCLAAIFFSLEGLALVLPIELAVNPRLHEPHAHKQPTAPHDAEAACGQNGSAWRGDALAAAGPPAHALADAQLENAPAAATQGTARDGTGAAAGRREQDDEEGSEHGSDGRFYSARDFATPAASASPVRKQQECRAQQGSTGQYAVQQQQQQQQQQQPPRAEPKASAPTAVRPDKDAAAIPAAASRRFESVLLLSMLTLSIIYMAVGAVVALAFPAIDSGSVTAFLAARAPSNRWLAVVNGLIGLAILFTFPLQMQPALMVLDTLRHPHHGHADDAPAADAGARCGSGGEWLRTLRSVCVRFGLTACCTLVVFVVPQLELLISMLGALCQASLSALPFLISLTLHARGAVLLSRGRASLHLALLCYCVLAATMGSWSALSDVLHYIEAGRA